MEIQDYPTGWKLATILFSLFLGTILVAIDTTIISVAIPKISTQFHALDDVGWYGSAYLITLTALQPAGGQIYKIFPPRTVYLAAIVIFEAGSVFCAAAPNSPLFIFGRAIAGTGAAFLIQGALSVITLVAPLEKRPLYIGLVVSCFGISASFSPVVGGALTTRTSWRWCFWINVPIGALAFGLILISFRLKAKQETIRAQSSVEKAKNLDPLGIILLLGGVSCLFLALQWGGSRKAWSSFTIIGLLVGCGLIITIFAILQWRLGDFATIPPRVLKRRTVWCGALTLFFISMSSNIKMYYLPFYFQAVRGTSALRSGVDFLALAVPQVVGVVFAGGLTTKTGHYFPTMLFGTVVCSVGTGLLILNDSSTKKIEWALWMIIAGLGDGLCTNMPYSAIQAIIENEHDVFTGNAIATFATLAGGAIGISLGENILVGQLLKKVPRFASTIDAKSVVAAGALNLESLTSSPTVLRGLRRAYGSALSAVMICATVTICISTLTTLGMQRLNLVQISKEREKERERERGRENGARKSEPCSDMLVDDDIAQDDKHAVATFPAASTA